HPVTRCNPAPSGSRSVVCSLLGQNATASQPSGERSPDRTNTPHQFAGCIPGAHRSRPWYSSVSFVADQREQPQPSSATCSPRTSPVLDRVCRGNPATRHSEPESWEGKKSHPSPAPATEP